MSASVSAEKDAEGRRGGSALIPGGRRDRIRLALLTCASAAVYATYSLVSLARFRASAYDLVIFDQGIRSYSRFEAPVSIIKGVHNEFGVDFTLLGDHWSPLLSLLAPLYWIHDGPGTLLVAQAVLLAAAIPFLWLYTFRALADGRLLGVRNARLVAYAVSFGYAISWPVVETVAFDFHEAAFVPLLVAILLESHQAGRRSHVILAAAGILLVKEDMGLLVAGLGFCFLVQRGSRRLGAAFVVTGILAAYIATQVLIPAFGGRSNYYWAYSALGGDAQEAIVNAVLHPIETIKLLWTPPMKMQTLLLTLAPVLLLPLFSPITIALVPLVLERMLSNSFPNWWVSEYHYTAFIVMIVFIGGVDGACRISRRVSARAQAKGDGSADDMAAKFINRWAVCVIAVGVAIVPFSSLGKLFTPGFYSISERQKAAAEAVSRIPDGVLVEASNNLAPALSSRTQTLLWDRTPRRAPWILADAGKKTFPFLSLDEQISRVRFLLTQGYEKQFESNGYLVLFRR
ncbi:DUF2079 domain-containing protein [Acrocarpospora macrocephala]|uniref:DUF2079 domain-containing protein n=1 Tax=Acrocarpospora macrocephala TaxID=150177 RepID=A0A5M3WTM9_9ACTN|nr:DUF2079 domain-containing protein [Acrocarpospora macrocephala]GES12030.1 hypothetical protein Amac_056270 [Acrocarpospora macrocephala]